MKYKRYVAIFLLLCMVAALMVGCGKKNVEQAQERQPTGSNPAEGITPERFIQLQKGMYTWEVVDFLGYPSPQLGSGVVKWEYDLTDGRRGTIYFIQEEHDGVKGFFYVTSLGIYDPRPVPER